MGINHFKWKLDKNAVKASIRPATRLMWSLGTTSAIANAPNPSGQAILRKNFDNGIAPVSLLAGAIAPMLIMGICFYLLKAV